MDSQDLEILAYIYRCFVKMRLLKQLMQTLLRLILEDYFVTSLITFFSGLRSD